MLYPRHFKVRNLILLLAYLAGLVHFSYHHSIQAQEARQHRMAYPESKRVDQIDQYHEHSVPDPYRWLEDDVRNSPDVAAWVQQQNSLTQQHLAAIPAREKISEWLTAKWNYPRYSLPFRKGRGVSERYFQYKNDGLQSQSVLYVLDSLDGTPQVLLDPNQWSDDGSVAMSGTVVSPDGQYVAYGVAEAGSDWSVWKFWDLARSVALEDQLHWIKFGSPSWGADGQGVYYGRFPEPSRGEQFQSPNREHAVYYHRLGDPQTADRLVYRRLDEPDWNFNPEVSDDGRFLIITVSRTTDAEYQILYQDLLRPDSELQFLVNQFQHEYSFLGNLGSSLFFQTNLDAPRRRIVSIDVDQFDVDQFPANSPISPNWLERIAESEHTLQSSSLIGGKLIANYLADASSLLKVFDTDGQLEHQLQFPTIGSVSGFDGTWDNPETFYSFTSFTHPPVNYRYDVKKNHSQVLHRSEVAFDPNEYQVQQVFFPSQDGTKIPMFLCHRKGLKRDGNSPTLLYGYGGFDISLTPTFSLSRALWMDLGGVFASANLRGGGEYGASWHEAGKQHQKQNVFDDFQAAAEYLIREKYTSPTRLAIEGRSNGGLLVGACMTQRPELYAACLPGVGVLDMLRYDKFTAGRYWVGEYGSSEDSAEFETLLRYSPLHNIRVGTKYPATLITTSDTDDRVVPAHSFKFAAALQHADAGDRPLLIRIETRAGHGAGKSTEKAIAEIADVYAFLVQALMMEPVSLPASD